MVIDCLTDRLGTEPNVSVKQSITIHIMVNFHGDGHGNGYGMCELAFTI